jgi:altronate hydrolase
MNPSPGNIRDGLLTVAMKSAGAAKKGGTSPITAVLDYPEYATEPGLNLQCTPGNDVACVTAQWAPAPTSSCLQPAWELPRETPSRR